MGTIHVLTDVVGGAGADSGLIVALGGDIAGVNIDGSLIGGTAHITGAIGSVGTIDSVQIGGNLTGANLTGANSLDSSGIIHAQRIVSISIGGSLIAGTNNGLGTLTHDGCIYADEDIGTITVAHDVIGNSTNPVIISAAQQAVPTAFADVALHNLIVHGSVTDAFVLAGYDFNGNGVDADASINNIAVDGNWTTSSVEAGTGPGLDGRIGTNDDVNLSGAGVKDNPNLHSIIGSITIGGQVAGTAGGTDHFGFVADEIAALSVDGTVYNLNPGPYNDDIPLGSTDDFDAHEIQFIHETPASLPNGTVGDFYTHAIGASGGTGPYTFTVSFGSLPAGLFLSSTGVLSGTPTLGGSYFFQIEAADQNDLVGTQNYTVTVNPFFNDNFTRADSGTLGTGWETPTSFVPAAFRFTYREVVFHPSVGGFDVQNQTVVDPASSHAFAAEQVAGQSGGNVTVTADVNASDPQALAVGVFARAQSDGRAYVAALTNSGIAEILLFDGANATFTVLASANVGTNSAPLKFTVTGTGTATTLALFLNGNSKPAVTVSGSNQTTLDIAGGFGIFAWGANGIVDNFSVTGP
jgi:hypothetical protein